MLDKTYQSKFEKLVLEPRSRLIEIRDKGKSGKPGKVVKSLWLYEMRAAEVARLRELLEAVSVEDQEKKQAAISGEITLEDLFASSFQGFLELLELLFQEKLTPEFINEYFTYYMVQDLLVAQLDLNGIGELQKNLKSLQAAEVLQA